MADQFPPFTVAGYGMWTAAGHDGPSSVAAMRAGVSGASKAQLWDRSTGETINAFRVHSHQWWEGSSFLPELIAPVIEDCLAQIAEMEKLEATDPEGIPILMTLAPKDRPDRAEDLEKKVFDGLAKRLGRALPNGSGAVPGGRVGLPHLLTRMVDIGADTAILVGAESFLRQRMVDFYVMEDRLLGAETSSGFIPGEAAAAIIVTRRRVPGLRLIGVGGGMAASGARGSKESPVTGDGLTEAIRRAISAAGLEFHDINVLMADLNGEHFKFKELSFASARLDRLPEGGVSYRPRGHVEHWNVVETIGEVGAAMMPAAMGWAFAAGQEGYLPGRVVFTAGEDSGQRVAVVGEWADG